MLLYCREFRRSTPGAAILQAGRTGEVLGRSGAISDGKDNCSQFTERFVEKGLAGIANPQTSGVSFGGASDTDPLGWILLFNLWAFSVFF